MAKLFRIGQTKRSGSGTIDDYIALNHAFITRILHPDQPEYGAWVDSFGLLYSMLREIHQLSARGEMHAEIGDEHEMHGMMKDGVWAITVNGPGPLTHFELSIPELQWSLFTIIKDLVDSMHKAGINVDYYARKFPPLLVDREPIDLDLPWPKDK